MIVRFFARARDVVGQDSCQLDLPPGALVRDLHRRLLLEYPGLADLLKHSVIAVDQKLASADMAISNHNEAAVLPPVSGG
jgi:molybdopterin converting factor small subunit